MGRVLAVDLGTKRIGIAVSDAGRSLASPLTVIERSGSLGTDHQRIAGLVREEEADLVVVGLPVDLQGRTAAAATSAVNEARQLATVVPVPVETYDERMTTAAAHKNLAAQGVSSKKRRAQIDKFAAAVLLQSWLDGSRPSNQGTGGGA